MSCWRGFFLILLKNKDWEDIEDTLGDALRASPTTSYLASYSDVDREK